MKQQSKGTGFLNNANIDEAKHQSILRKGCLYTLTGKPIQINVRILHGYMFCVQLLKEL